MHLSAGLHLCWQLCLQQKQPAQLSAFALLCRAYLTVQQFGLPGQQQHCWADLVQGCQAAASWAATVERMQL